MDRFDGFVEGMRSTCRTLLTSLGLRPRESPSRSSPSTLSVSAVDKILKDHYLDHVRYTMNQSNVLMGDLFWKVTWGPDDWGFDEVWPAAADQPWFGKWIRDYELEERSKKPPFIRAFEDEVDYAHHQMHMDIHRQFVGRTAEIPVEREK